MLVENKYDLKQEEIKLFENLNRECLLFPTYAKRDNKTNEWIIKVKGWALSHNCSIAKKKTIMGITKSVAGKSVIDQDSARMFEQRFKYFLATNKRNKHFYIQSIGTTTLEESRLNLKKFQDNSQLQQTLLNHPNIFNQNNDEGYIETDTEDEDIEFDIISYFKEDIEFDIISYFKEDPMLFRPKNPISLLLDKNHIHKIDQPVFHQPNGICLKTKSSGFLSGEFILPHDKILNWAQDQNHCEARLIQIQSTSVEQTSKFLPNYGIVNLIEPIGISVISDIDDTIKDTRILLGARTVLSKTFFELPKDVTGMSDTYMKWYSQGVSFHYVSNSPFQLLPMLNKFLRDSNFPPGSMHLRDDSRLISRLVETPGLAKTEAIRDILIDFPQRKFILIGDSGEIDLEIYTKLALEYPNQIMKIYIRDVTTPDNLNVQKKKEGPRRSNTLSSIFNPKRRSQSLPSVPTQESTISTETSLSATLIENTNKFQKHSDINRTMTEALVEYAVQKPYTGHGKSIRLKPENSKNSLDSHSKKKNLSTFEACHQLYERIKKSQAQLPSIKICLFKNVKKLDDDTEIINALWNIWDSQTASDNLEYPSPTTTTDSNCYSELEAYYSSSESSSSYV